MADDPESPGLPPGPYPERRDGEERRDDDRRDAERRHDERRQGDRRGTGSAVDWDGIERRHRERRRLEDIIDKNWPLPGGDGG